MSTLEKYTQCLEIVIEHGYYADVPPVTLEPDEETAHFLRRTGRIWRRMRSDRWVVMQREDEREEFVYTFKVIPTDALFHHVTERAEADGAEVEVVRHNGTWGVLKCISNDVTLRIHPPEKYLEFVLIPRHTAASAVIELREARGMMEFMPPEEAEILGMKALRVVSKKKVPLSERQGYRFRLIEVRNSGERVLASHVPTPHPAERSVADLANAVTTYFYY